LSGRRFIERKFRADLSDFLKESIRIIVRMQVELSSRGRFWRLPVSLNIDRCTGGDNAERFQKIPSDHDGLLKSFILEYRTRTKISKRGNDNIGVYATTTGWEISRLHIKLRFMYR
jgi:hypothetical protein